MVQDNEFLPYLHSCAETYAHFEQAVQTLHKQLEGSGVPQLALLSIITMQMRPALAAHVGKEGEHIDNQWSVQKNFWHHLRA